MRAVAVIPEDSVDGASERSGRALITPRGLRVEGPDRDTLLAVLRALG